MKIFITGGVGYVDDPKTLSTEEALNGCAASLDSYGFCVIENIIPNEEVLVICEEILEAQKKVQWIRFSAH